MSHYSIACYTIYVTWSRGMSRLWKILLFYIVFELHKIVHISTTRCAIEMEFGSKCGILNGLIEMNDLFWKVKIEYSRHIQVSIIMVKLVCFNMWPLHYAKMTTCTTEVDLVKSLRCDLPVSSNNWIYIFSEYLQHQFSSPPQKKKWRWCNLE